LLAVIFNLRNTSVGSYLSSGISSSSSKSSGSMEIENRARKVNESLYELHKPSTPPSIQIVLFHGLQPGDYSDAHLWTWQSEDGSCIWPQTWLVDAVPGAHVLSVSYNGGLAKTSDNYREADIYIITENLLSDLLQGNIGQEECPVILVGHSIGGLVIKHLCNRANLVLNQKEGREKAMLQIFLKNIKGVFYYATPHHGTSIPKKWEKDLPRALVTYFKTLSTETARLNDEFESWKRNWKFLSLGEGRPTNLGPLKGFFTSVFVPEASAREGDFNLVDGADHFSICKPRDRSSRSFYKLKDFAAVTAKDAQV
jgi:pimeloyl-ACP methyl ester carboxylesterase